MRLTEDELRKRRVGSAMCCMGWSFRLMFAERLTVFERNHARLAAALTGTVLEEIPWRPSLVRRRSCDPNRTFGRCERS